MHNVDDLKCIRVDFTAGDGNTRVDYISWNTFTQSYLLERWEGERRTGKVMTIFGMAHKVTTVRNPFDGSLSRRVFTFPKSRAHAEELDATYNA